MQPNPPDHARARRQFFKKALWLGTAAVAGGAARRRAGAVGPAETASARDSAGYRLTAHIRRYYERASS
jgi:hypothetical protein